MIPIEYDIIVFKEDHAYVAYCPELDISSCGQDVQQAKEMLKPAVRLFIEEAEKMGTLEDIVVVERNIKLPRDFLQTLLTADTAAAQAALYNNSS